jgi:hypothetical protein
MANFPEVAEAVADAREELIDIAELRLRKAVQDGEAWAIALTLKTIGKGRGYVERHEVQNLSDSPEWRALRKGLIEALSPYPAALAALLQVLRSRSNGNGHAVADR